MAAEYARRCRPRLPAAAPDQRPGLICASTTATAVMLTTRRTVAAGVSKAKADVVLISGHHGDTRPPAGVRLLLKPCPPEVLVGAIEAAIAQGPL